MLSSKKKDYLRITKQNKEIDEHRGAKYIPKKVKKAREAGITVKFIIRDAEKFWLFPDKKRVYHN